MGFDFGSAISGALKGLGGSLSPASSYNNGKFQSVSEIFGGQSPENAASKLINYKYKYRVSKYQMIIPGRDPIELVPEAINRILISRYYDDCIHPIMEVHTSMPPRVHEMMIQNKNEAKVRLRVQAVKFDIASQKIGVEDYINDTFCIYTDDSTPFKMEPEYAEANKANGGGGTYDTDRCVFNIADYTVDYLISLWKEEHINAMRSTVNKKYDNTTLATAINAIYSEAGINKMLISPMDNENSYSELIIPPTNLMNIPKYLETTFGTYYSGTMSFLDYRCLYLLSKNGVCDAYEDDEYKRTIITIKKPTKTTEKRVGTTEDPEAKMYYMFIKNDYVSPASPASTRDAIGGNNVVIVDPNTNQTTTVEGAGKQRGSGNKRIIADNYSNTFNKSVKLSEINEQNGQMTVDTFEYKEFAFTPNKEFIIISEDRARSEYNGFYRIVESISTFTKVGAYLDITGRHRFVFKKALTQEEVDQILAVVSPTMNVKSTTKSDSDSQAQKKSEENKTATTTSTKDASGTTSAVTSSSDATPTVNGPQPKTVTGNETSISNVSQKTTIPKNPNYQYDNLGNIKGIDIPEYKIITANDSIMVSDRKKEVQAEMLPCSGPKPKTTSSQ